MSSNFNNIAGGPFQPFVKKQIDIRKEFLKESHIKRENKHLLYYNNRNSFIRITSNTELSPSHPLSLKYNLSGKSLAEKYILQGDLVEKNIIGENQENFINFDDDYQQSNTTKYDIRHRGGLNSNGLYNMLPDKPLGYKPVPGLTSINISTSGKLGTLQYADINFICYDIKQLEIMDALYMKLGFSIIIEWGHTLYIDDNKQLSKINPLNVFNFNNKETLLKEINNKKNLHRGNYDAMLGTISNFNWVCNNDGTYSCSIKVVGAGDILDSLKINHSSFRDKTNENIPYADKNLSILNNVLYSLLDYGVKNSNQKFNKITPRNNGYRRILNTNFSNPLYNFISFNNKGNIQGDDISIRGNHHSLINGMEDIENVDILKPELFNLTTVNYNIGNNEGTTNKESLQPQTYITLGHLLALITSNCLIYSNKKPYIYIDFNDSLNFCSTYPYQLFLDPRVCIIPNNYNYNVLDVKKDLYPPQENSENNIYNIQRGWRNDFISFHLNNYNHYLKTDNPKVRANLMYINININFITNILKDLSKSSKDENVFLSQFMNKLLEEINISLGGNNNFRLLVDDTSKSLRIIDDTRLSSLVETNNNDYSIIPLFGKESFVYNYSFSSTIPPNMASMITISAQAKPSQFSGDVFAFSNLSRNMTDRLLEDKKIINDTLEEKPINISPDNIKLVDLFFKDIYEGDINSLSLNISSMEAVKNIYREIITKYRNEKNSNHKGSTIIPLKFSLEMDGLSGIIPNSAFLIPNNLLPSSYLTKKGLSKIAFIIHKIEQRFDNNKWITKIEGQTINIRFDDEDKKEIKSSIQSTPTFDILSNSFSPDTVNLKQKEMHGIIYTNGRIPNNVLRPISNQSEYIGDIQSDNGQIRLFTPASVSLEQLLEQADKDNILLKINSAYRTLEDQIRVRKENAPSELINDKNFIMNDPSTSFTPFTAIPGTSNHGFALAVDFANNNLTKINELMSEYLWLKNNAPKYGFKRIASEPWHWEYQI